MKCEFCGKDTNSLTPIGTTPENQRYGCSLCNYILTQEKMNNVADFAYETEDGITIWMKDNKVVDAWRDYGDTAIPLNKLVQTNKDIYNPIVLIEFMREHKNDRFCTHCGKIITEKEIAGRHFAFEGCSECWEKYKKSNSGACSLCRQPYYVCTC